jgi:hypothetical protein
MVSGKINQPRQASQTFTDSKQEAMDRGLNARVLFFNLTKAYDVIAAQKFDGERFNLRKLKELEVKEKYQIEITNRSAALENLIVDEDVNRALENIKESIKTSAMESLGLHELKKHKPWFDKECVGFLDRRKQAKMQWIQVPSRSNADHLNTARRDASRHFRNKTKAYVKAKIEELETNSRIKNVRDLYWGINDFKKEYQPRTIVVKTRKEI